MTPFTLQGLVCQALPPLNPLSLSKLTSSLIFELAADTTAGMEAREVDALHPTP